MSSGGCLPGDGTRLHCAHQPLAGLSPLPGDRWEALDSDPQFLLEMPLPQPAGVYRITIDLAAEQPVRPCLYLDVGDGWSEATCVQLGQVGDSSRWTALTCLDRIAGPARFDPMEHPGHFRFGDATLERLSEGEAILMLLERCTRLGDRASAIVEEAYRRAASQGSLACCRWLLSLLDEDRSPPPADDYFEWVRRFDTLDDAQRCALRQLIGALPQRPLISLILPVAGLPADPLRACIDGVLEQVYPDWELWLLDDPSSSTATRQALAGYVQGNSRVHLLEARAGTGALSREEAILSTRGSFVAFLDSTPQLRPHALFAFADAIIRNPAARMLYSDHDRIAASGRRCAPDFKPDWNPELFRSQDFLTAFALYESELARNAARLAGDGSLHAFASRCAAGLEDRQIAHIPLVLFHLPADTRMEGTGFGPACAAPSTCVEPAEAAAPGALPAPAPKISLIIPTRDRLELLRRCVESILALTTYPDFEVIVVDNQSVEAPTLEYLAALQQRPRVRVLSHDAPFNYSAINNFAVAHVDGTLVGLVNNDIEVISPDWLEQMAWHALQPGTGAVGAMLYYPDDTIQHAGVILGVGGVAGHPYSRSQRGTAGYNGRARVAQNLSAVTGACLLVRRAVYLEAGGLNEKLTVAFNDVDFCLRLLALGYRNVWTPLAELYHHESASRGSEDTPEKLARFQSEVDYMRDTWAELIAHDPAYNPNLSLSHGDAFGLAPQPRHALSAWLEGLPYPDAVTPDSADARMAPCGGNRHLSSAG